METKDNDLELLKLKMTSNNTPEPYHINVISSSGLYNCTQNDFYTLFDNDSSTGITVEDSRTQIFELYIGRKVLVRKFSSNSGNYSLSVYGYDNENEQYELINNGTNEKMYSKYKFIINSKYGSWSSILYIDLYILKEDKIIKSNNGFIGLDRTNDVLMSFDDISNHNLYQFNKLILNNNLENLKEKYPFKMMKFIKQ